MNTNLRCQYSSSIDLWHLKIVDLLEMLPLHVNEARDYERNKNNEWFNWKVKLQLNVRNVCILNFINFHEKYIKFYYMYTNIYSSYKYIKFNVMKLSSNCVI